MSAGAGISGLSYTFLITKSYAALEFTINRASKEENKRIFNSLEKNKTEIEQRFGAPLQWEYMDHAKMSRVKFQLDHVNFYNDEDLNKIMDFFLAHISNFYDGFNPVVQELKRN